MKKRMNIYSIEDQMNRFGITKEEAEEKIKNIKNVNIYSVEWQMNRFGITKEEAEEKIRISKEKTISKQKQMSEFDFNSMIPSKKEHWIKKGFTEEEAIKRSYNVINIAKSNVSDFVNDRKLNPDKYIGSHTTTIEYYLKKGFTEEESLVKLKDRQTTFSLEKCISKYGLDDGIKRWEERQKKWLKSIDGKITNEMKDSTSFDFFLRKNNNNIDLAKEELISVFKKRYQSSTIGMASKASMKVFNNIINICEKNGLRYYCGTNENREYYIFNINDGRIYTYDFTIPSINLIFEFHGKFWHSKTPTNKVNEIGCVISYEKDQMKKELAIKNGFDIIELFEEDGLTFNIRKSIDYLNRKLDSQ